MTSKLVPWPKREEYVTPTDYGPGMTMAQIADYESARAKAAIARLNVAVAALHNIAAKATHAAGSIADEALALIGEIPSE